MKTNNITESIRVVVADDSPAICRLLRQYLESDPAVKVVKTVQNGKNAMKAVQDLRPDVLTLDLNMPVLNGFETLKHIMAEHPIAVVLISGVSKEAAQITQHGLELGAVDFILKYEPGLTISPDSLRREIIAKVKAAAKVKLIRPIASHDELVNNERPLDFNRPSIRMPEHPSAEWANNISGLVVIGASAGGPVALKDLLSSLRIDFSFPLVIVQHMPEGFTAVLASQFNRQFSFPVREAVHGDYLSPGTVMIAPGNRHFLICSDGATQTSLTPAVNGHRPSIDVTMQSAAQIFGSYTTGVLLSGMGIDGIQGLLAIKQKCGTTFAQSRETCVIDTMPYTAIKKGIVQRVGSPTDIAHWLTEGLPQN